MAAGLCIEAPVHANERRTAAGYPAPSKSRDDPDIAAARTAAHDLDVIRTLLATEVLPQICSALPLRALAALSKASRAGCVAVECVPLAAWLSFVEAHAGIGLSPLFSGTLASIVPLRDSLRFWLPALRKLGLPREYKVPLWRLRSAEELAASQTMAENALAFLRQMEREGPSFSDSACSVHRLRFRFDDFDLERLAAPAELGVGVGGDEYGVLCESNRVSLEIVNDLRVSGYLRARASQDAQGKYWRWSVEFRLILGEANQILGAGGVQKALVVRLFSSSPAWRSQPERCVSYAGHNGSVQLLPASGLGPLGQMQRSGEQFAHFKRTGEVHALAVAHVVEYQL
eukprot:TRINITY_DN47259_c0_g1_i1.p1 TRINITY_DN47259_c0_g1~~TRINITY_DN47259_c0_g1_i1.p1  ORF type:complete len:358 (-),score=66.83 TRINITY_DN47259_c0_g1_i1:65-1096(-)